MANERFLTAGDFPSNLGATPFYGSGPYAPPPLPSGLDITAACTATMAPCGTLPWASELPLPADPAATTAHFDSALSSLVSSPAHASGGDDVAIGDLIGRLGSICHTAASANNSCYSTPLSSPHRGASPASAFRRSCCYPSVAPPLDTAGGGSLSRVASSKSLGAVAPALENAETETSPKAAAGMTETTPAKGAGSGAARKRKASGNKSKMAAALTNGSPKLSKVDGDEDVTADAAEEPVKDYIHVRARRGQATDSHSLAERVRREKISERMKLLQSLVPGCNKITGKALMLDEIINYVQSLQRQVEFLSMKLSTINPQLDVAAQYLPSDKDDDMMMMMRHDETGTAAAVLGYHPQAFLYADPFAGAVHPTCTSSSFFHPDGVGFGWEERDLQSVAPSHNQQPPPEPYHGHRSHGGQQQKEAAATVSHRMVEP